VNRAQIESLQLERLRAMIAPLLAGNAFFARRLRQAGIGPELASLDEFRRRLPLVDKRELAEDQRRHPPYGSNLTFPRERYTRFSQTSSTTGTPLYWLDTPESWEWMLGNWRRVYASAGVTAADRIFFAFSFGPFLGFWTAFEAALRLGCLCIPGGGMKSGVRLRGILGQEATVLCCTPTYALRLAEVAAEEGIDLRAARVARIIVAGEPGGSVPGTRAAIERRWNGARVFDHHGMTETGPVSYPCPRLPAVLHVIESSFIPEVIDPATGQPAPPGAPGELVLTNLGRIGSPLLRYRTGDWVHPAAAAPCGCGSHEMALQGGILGRTDDMIVVRGVNIYPSALDDIVHASHQVAEYRVEVHAERTLPELRVQVEPLPSVAAPARLADHLRAAFRNAFSLRVHVEVVAPGTLPRFEMKARRWTRIT